MAVVTISRQFGAGGRTLAENLCERFGFRLVDAYVVDELARKAKVSPDWLSSVEREASSTFLGLLSDLVSSGLFYRSPSVPEEQSEKKKYLALLNRIMTSMANEGGYVLLGRGSQFALKNHRKAFHVLLVAEHEHRAKFLIEHYGLSRYDAEAMIKERERRRGAIATNLFQHDLDDSNLYHVVLNTSRIHLEWAVDAVSDLLKRFMEEEAG